MQRTLKEDIRSISLCHPSSHIPVVYAFEKDFPLHTLLSEAYRGLQSYTAVFHKVSANNRDPHMGDITHAQVLLKTLYVYQHT